MALHLKSTGIDFTDFSDTNVTGTGNQTELLDDYEDGTWTPTATAGGAISPNYSGFAKVGSIVKINSYISHTGGSGTAQAYGGVPFASGDATYYTGTAQSAATGPPGMVLRLTTDSTSIQVYDNTTTNGQHTVTGDQLNGSHNMIDIVFIEALT